MTSQSVKFRLTLWFSLAFFIAATVVFGIFYLVTGQVLSRQTNSTLSSHGDKILQVLGRQEQGMHTILEKQAFIRDFSMIPGMVVVFLDASGQAINSSVAPAPDSAVLARLFRDSRSARSPIFADEPVAGSQMRFWAAAVFDSAGQLSGVVLVAHPIDVIENALTALLLILSVVLVASVIPAVLGGYLLASRALAPVSEMSARLRKISSENLDERVTDPATGDELEELAHTFNGLLDRLGQAFKRERQFIGDVAHELKTPLTTLQSSVEIILSKKRRNEEYRQAFGDALVDIDRLAKTLKSVLDLAWSDADSAVLSGEVFSLSKEMEELFDLASKMAASKKIVVKSQITKDIRVFGKRDKLGRAILNLIDNAIKYTPEKGQVVLSLKKESSQAILAIKDTGVGIESSQLPHIFDRFYRGKENGKTAGSGLGLAISQAVVISHRGEIKVESQVGRGSIFTIALPLA